MRLWLFVVRHRYRSHKLWWHDRDVLYLAAQLAAVLEERGTTHVHSPWANHSALLSFVAARLMGVTYSVQARASEIHRSAQAPMVADRLQFAEFVVTNSHYNERHLRALLRGSPGPPIHTIYNGVELFRFQPKPPGPTGDASLLVLSVGRLIEPKGFRYLLRACRLLRDRGVEFTCEIIGGPQDPLDTIAWIDLRKLHTGLGLESTVRFRGEMSLSSVLSWYRRADIVVLPCVRARDGSHDITPNIADRGHGDASARGVDHDRRHTGDRGPRASTVCSCRRTMRTRLRTRSSACCAIPRYVVPWARPRAGRSRSASTSTETSSGGPRCSGRHGPAADCGEPHREMFPPFPRLCHTVEVLAVLPSRHNPSTR